LEDAGVKLATVASDVMGLSGREMMRALIGGVADPQDLAELARARLRTKIPELRKALTARFRDHHAFLLACMLAHVEALEADIDVLSERIAELTEPWQGQVMILDSITGVGATGSGGNSGRDRSGYEPVSYRRVPGLLGWSLFRAAGVRRTQRLGQAPQGITLASRCAHRVRLVTS
jgi:hypothetical protein